LSAIDKLRRAGVQPPSEQPLIQYALHQAGGPHPFQGIGASAPGPDAGPLVSCLMVTRGDVRLLRYSIGCYARQTYAARELVIVTDDEAAIAGIEAVVAKTGAKAVSIHLVGCKLPLGDLRNISIARSTGDIVMQWDDDDLYDPARIETTVAVMAQSQAGAAVLSRWLMWWPARGLAGLSQRYWWEGSLAVRRQHAPVYPSLSRGEDSLALKSLADTTSVAVIEAPFLYLYVITGQNTWDVPHFETMFALGDCQFVGDEFDVFNSWVADRMPIEAYSETLLASGGGS
jgi:glycosyltransferase involved in cell wall biosynthesis